MLPPAPYPGLRPFETHEWPTFFGREKMTDEVINQLIRQHLVVVHGDSGCGKSSLIRAGVLAQLEQEHARSGISWRTCTMLPRDAPLWGLAKALAKLDGRADDTDHVRTIRRRLNLGADAPPALADMLRQGEDDHICILVDQFEELFSFTKRHGTDEARIFVDVLVSLQRNPPPGLYVILTMRSEFLGVCARYRGLAEAVNKTQYLLSGMERPALLRAIREPAPLYGGEVTRPLAERLIADGGGGQDQLPLIQHGLMLLWRCKVVAARDQQKLSEADETVQSNHGDHGPEWRLDLEDYRGAGGLESLLSAHADDVMAAAAPDPDRKRVVEHLFRALTDINAEGHAVRRPQSLAQLHAVTAADEVTLRAIVDTFRADGVSFLNPYGPDPVSPNQQIDISHEALIRCWQKIADEKSGWLHREFRDGLIWKTLRVQAQKGETLSAAATTDRDAWLKTLPSEAWTERYDDGWAEVQGLMAASRTKEAKRQQELEEARRAEAEERARREAAADLAAKEQELREAQERVAQEAEARAKEADAGRRRSKHLAIVAGAFALAALVAAGAASWSWQRAIRAQSEVEAALREAELAQAQTEAALQEKETARAETETALREAQAARAETEIALREAQTARAETETALREAQTARAETETALQEAQTARAETEIALQEAQTARAETETALREAQIARDDAESARKKAKKAQQDAQFGDALYRAEQARNQLSAGNPVLAMQLALAGLPAKPNDSAARSWVGETAGALAEALGEQRGFLNLRGHEESVRSVEFSRDGSRIVSGSDDDTVRIWDAASGDELEVLSGHDKGVRAAAFSPDGARIVSGSADNTVRIWDAASGEELRALRGHRGAVRAAAFSPDGARIVSGSEDTTVRVWDAVNGEEPLTLHGHEQTVRAAAFSPAGHRIVSGSDDATVRVWDTSSGEKLWVDREERVWAAAFSPAGDRIVSGSEDATVRVWDAASGEELLVLRGHEDRVYAVAFSPAGNRVVSGSRDNTVRVWDVASGQELLVLRSHEEQVYAVAFSPDGDRIASGAGDNTVRVTWIGRNEQELLATARARVPPELSDEQRRRFYLATE